MLFRGPTHNIPFLPQFAPDKNIYEYLPYANLLDVMKTRDDVRLVEESQPGLADSIFIIMCRNIGQKG